MWPESKTGLIPPFDCGRDVDRLCDIASNRLIFSRGFDTMFAEYKTTSPALASVKNVLRYDPRIDRRPLELQLLAAAAEPRYVGRRDEQDRDCRRSRGGFCSRLGG